MVVRLLHYFLYQYGQPRTIADVRDLTHKFKTMMAIEPGDSPVDPERPGAVLGDLEALQGVVKFPVRIKCATLAWNTLLDALDAPGS